MGSDIKVVTVQKKENCTTEDEWMNDIFFKDGANECTIDSYWSVDSLSELLKFKQLDETDVQSLVEFGLIEINNDCPWSAYSKSAKYEDVQFVFKEVNN